MSVPIISQLLPIAHSSKCRQELQYRPSLLYFASVGLLERFDGIARSMQCAVQESHDLPRAPYEHHMMSFKTRLF
eukprot:5614988-Amphidinium_carterae.1